MAAPARVRLGAVELPRLNTRSLIRSPQLAGSKATTRG